MKITHGTSLTHLFAVNDTSVDGQQLVLCIAKENARMTLPDPLNVTRTLFFCFTANQNSTDGELTRTATEPQMFQLVVFDHGRVLVDAQFEFCSPPVVFPVCCLFRIGTLRVRAGYARDVSCKSFESDFKEVLVCFRKEEKLNVQSHSCI